MVTENTTLGTQEILDNDRLLDLYMNYVLEKETPPKTVYRFCKENNLEEEEFYNFYGSFEGLRQGIWKRFVDHTLDVIKESSEVKLFSPRERMLTFYYTLFEVLTANRSYVLFSLKESRNQLRNLEQLKGVRSGVKNYAASIVREINDEKQNKVLKHSETIFSEAAWLQFLFLLKFWTQDNSPKFEHTDVAIEKSVNTMFDVLDNTALDRILDLGKFLWKERMA